MGTRTKGKEVIYMKRFSVIFLSLIFTIGTMVTSIPVSYAYPYDGENTTTDENTTQLPETDQTDQTTDQPSVTDGTVEDPSADISGDGLTDTTDAPADPSVKDTSWFDYTSPKKSYTISTEGELLGLASLFNEEQTDNWKPTRTENFEGVTFTLTDNIELSGEWEPIGSDESYNFAGIFDGDGHTISGISITNNSPNTGLFGYLVGEVRNLDVEGNIKVSTGSCGAVAGILTDTGKITNCTSKVTISAGNKTGGIAGYNNGGTIEECTNIGNISGTFKVGGVTGENWGGTITKCRNLAEITSYERGVATYGTGGVTGRSVSASAEISESYNSGTVNSNTEATGGVVGYANAGGSSVKSCYNTGSIIITGGKTDKKVASKSGTKNSAKTKKQNKSADFTESSAGGVVGIVGVKGVKITNCYNIGEVRNADIYGGVIGSYLNEDDDQVSGSFIRNNYYIHDYFKTGTGFCDKEGTNEVSKSSTSVSGYSLMNMSSALGSAYMRDSSNMYGNNGYPVLRWQQPMSDDEKTYLTNVSKEIQKKLDRYMMKSSKEKTYGQCVLNFFNPGNYTSSALVKYIEAQEKTISEDTEEK